MDLAGFQEKFTEMTTIRENPFHPLVWLNGEPKFGEGVFVGGMSIVNAAGANVEIGDYCDIASFVSINCADSHKRCIGLMDDIERKDIILENHVFVGSHSVIKGGAKIGHHSVVAAGTIVDAGEYPPYSLLIGNPVQVKEGYYKKKLEEKNT